jgi:hypothetical protein
MDCDVEFLGLVCKGKGASDVGGVELNKFLEE